MDLVFSLIPMVLVIPVVLVYFNKSRDLVKQIAEVLVAVDEMLDDNKVTKEEIIKIKNESVDVWNAIKAFGKK